MIQAKRFWDNVTVRDEGGYYTIWLDERVLKSPHKNTLSVPSKALAEAIAEEWQAVVETINPESMPMTRMMNSTQERIPPQRAEIEAYLLEYLTGDVLIYRADAPEALVERQKAWDSWLDWSRQFNFHLVPIIGILGEDQDPENDKHAKLWMSKLSDADLVAFHEYVTISGSFVLAMAVIEGALSAKASFDLSRLDEDFQAEIWGMVDVKKEERHDKLAQILLAEQFLALTKAQASPLVN